MFLSEILSTILMKLSKMWFISICYFIGSRVPRFDPTAYIQDRQRRQKEAELKKLVYVNFSLLHLWWYSLLVFNAEAAWVSGLNCVFSVRLRKVRRDMLTSPILPERGRSRSREAYPQMTRSGSRGRSLSVERRGSRNSSENSLVDMDEMAKTLFRWWDYLSQVLWNL